MGRALLIGVAAIFADFVLFFCSRTIEAVERAPENMRDESVPKYFRQGRTLVSVRGLWYEVKGDKMREAGKALLGWTRQISRLT